MKMFSLLLFALPLFLLPGFASSQPLYDNAAQLAHPRIIFGKLIAAKSSAIVQVRENLVSGSSLCTGTLITPSIVLTAWHCVSDRANDMLVIVGGKQVRVRKVMIHPDVRTDDVTGLVYNDIALLRLSQRVSVEPLALLTSRQATISDLVTILGYGLTEFGSEGSLRQGVTQVDEVTSEFIVTLFNRFESNSCSGDSGGPALLTFQTSNGTVKSGIVGITSTGTSTNCFYGDRTSYINLQSPNVSSFIFRNAPHAKRV